MIAIAMIAGSASQRGHYQPHRRQSAAAGSVRRRSAAGRVQAGRRRHANRARAAVARSAGNAGCAARATAAARRRRLRNRPSRRACAGGRAADFRVSHDFADDADTPVGDWQTEGKGSVRIAKCGNALCGYVLNSSSNDKGEAVLINMKPKSEKQWTGSVYSQASGDTYYGTMDMKGRTRCASKPARSAASTAPATTGAGSRQGQRKPDVVAADCCGAAVVIITNMKTPGGATTGRIVFDWLQAWNGKPRTRRSQWRRRRRMRHTRLQRSVC